MNDGAIEQVVISSRIRLARNIADIPFPNKLHDERGILIAQKVYDIVKSCGEFYLHAMSNMSELDATILKEKHLISEHLLHGTKYGAAIINEEENISIMVNEEDHIREQCILKGLHLREAYEKINEIDDKLGENMKIAFDPKIGYLTSCLTNVGTGMRASVMMFLPAMTLTDNIDQYVKSASNMNITLRGVYGEGSDADGYTYQISNTRTLGKTEQETIADLERTIKYLVEKELSLRKMMLVEDGIEVKDSVFRAWGILTNAYKIDSKEFMTQIAWLKLGANLGIIKISDSDRLERLIIEAQPANLNSLCGKQMTADERDIFRAKHVAKSLTGLREN